MSIPLWRTASPSSSCNFQQDNACHKNYIHLTASINIIMRSLSSFGQHSHQISANKTPLRCGETGDSHHKCAAEKSAVMSWCQYGVNSECFQHLVGLMPGVNKLIWKKGARLSNLGASEIILGTSSIDHNY